MAQQKKGLITRLLEGKEKSEEYARSTLPTNRWQLFWDIFKGNFGKMVKVNLLIFIFCIPLILVVVFCHIVGLNNGIIYPFGANLGVGYPSAPALQGMSEWLIMQNDLILYIGLMITSIIAAVGISGGMYVIRNMVWTEGIFVANDFWRGVKLNYKNALQTAIFFCLFMLLTNTLVNVSEFSIASGTLSKGQTVWLRISQGMSYMFMALTILMSFWMLALGVNYKLKFFTMLRNAFLITIGTIIQSVFFGILAMLPIIFFMIGGSFFTMIGVIAVVFFAFSYALLVWLDFAQWVFDKFINPKIEGAKVGRGIYNKDGSSPVNQSDSGAALEYQRIILSHGRSRLVAKPIKPIDDSLQVYELPQAFTREDLQKLRESKKNIVEDTEAYAEEHKNDLRYVEYNKQFDEREKALQEDEQKKSGKRKKVKTKNEPPKMLGD